MAKRDHQHLSLASIESPENESELIDLIRAAHDSQTPIYPLGGGTATSFGLPGTVDAIGISLARMASIVDYPARDMTVTAQAGITWATLQQELAQHQQRLPIDPPGATRSHLGGVLAMNGSGPRRYAYGTAREWVIGIRAIDGRGVPFDAGGRVVKNVAGYDFCRLLTGSHGSFGIIVQASLKLQPIPARSAILSLLVPLSQLESQLEQLHHSAITPAAIQAEPMGSVIRLSVGLEGTDDEVDWQAATLRGEWQSHGSEVTSIVEPEEQQVQWRRWSDFPIDEGAAIRLKLTVLPSEFAGMASWIDQELPAASWLAHAGNGVIHLHLPHSPDEGLADFLLQRLAPAVRARGGHVVVMESPADQGITHEILWGSTSLPWSRIDSIRRQFDPCDILNRGRYYHAR